MQFYTLHGIINQEPEIIKTKKFVIIYLENDKTLITTADSQVMYFNDQGYAANIKVSSLEPGLLLTKVSYVPKNRHNYIINSVKVGEKILDILEKTSSFYIELLKVPQYTILESGHIITGYTKNKIKYNKHKNIRDNDYEKLSMFLI